MSKRRRGDDAAAAAAGSGDKKQKKADVKSAAGGDTLVDLSTEDDKENPERDLELLRNSRLKDAKLSQSDVISAADTWVGDTALGRGMIYYMLPYWKVYYGNPGPITWKPEWELVIDVPQSLKSFHALSARHKIIKAVTSTSFECVAFQPLNVGSHWIAVIYDTRQMVCDSTYARGRITVWDPLGWHYKNDAVINKLRARHTKMSVRVLDERLQGDGHSCGIWVIAAFMEYFADVVRNDGAAFTMCNWVPAPGCPPKLFNLARTDDASHWYANQKWIDAYRRDLSLVTDQEHVVDKLERMMYTSNFRSYLTDDAVSGAAAAAAAAAASSAPH